jgi:hypothetical protein
MDKVHKPSNLTCKLHIPLKVKSAFILFHFGHDFCLSWYLLPHFVDLKKH